MTQRIVGWVLTVATVACVLVNQRDVGIARDEVFYMEAGTRYANWWLGLVTFDHGVSGASIKGAFEDNHEHPPLMKTLSGLSHRVVHDKLGLLDELTAYRLPAAISHGVLVWLVYTMVLALWGFAEAVLAALCLLLLPRALFHAGLDCFDAPIMTMWFATIYAYWRCLDGRRWPWLVGVVWGLALATKHTAFLLPFALVVHYAAMSWRRRAAGPALASFGRALLERWRVVVAFAVLGPLTLFVLWPWLWLAPIGHIREWLAFHVNHVHYNYEYLGHNWNAPRFPWHVALVTTLYTVPVVTLGAAAIGACSWIARWRRGASVNPDRAPVLLLALSAAASIGPFFLGSTPIFGAEKHWMPALPTICIAAAVGAVWAARRAAEIVPKLSERIAIAIVGGAIVIAGATETITAHPYALTWYNALAGGAAGGADLGMNRQFWGVAARGVLPVIAQQPPGPVYSHDASLAWGWYARLGLLAPGYPDAGQETAGIDRSQLAIVIHEKHFNRHDYLIWSSYGTVQPIYVLRADGVPIVSVYRRAAK